MKKILVTGGGGFIGTYVCEELVARDMEPVILDNRGQPHAKYHTILGDVRDEVSVTEAVAHVDGVIHLAGVLGTQETIRNPSPAVEVNIGGGLNVLDACTQYDVPLVNIAVGNWFENNSYAITKSCVERFVQMYVKERGTNACTVRAVNAYGPRQVAAPPYGPSKVRKIAPAFICRTLAGLPIEVYGDGLQIMDMVHVRDVAHVLVSALDGPSGVTYSAGPGRETTVLDIAHAVIAEVGGGTIEHLPMRPGESHRVEVIADPSTLSPLGLGADDFVTLEDGLKETVAWFASNR